MSAVPVPRLSDAPDAPNSPDAPNAPARYSTVIAPMTDDELASYAFACDVLVVRAAMVSQEGGDTDASLQLRTRAVVAKLCSCAVVDASLILLEQTGWAQQHPRKPPSGTTRSDSGCAATLLQAQRTWRGFDRWLPASLTPPRALLTPLRVCPALRPSPLRRPVAESTLERLRQLNAIASSRPGCQRHQCRSKLSAIAAALATELQGSPSNRVVLVAPSSLAAKELLRFLQRSLCGAAAGAAAAPQQPPNAQPPPLVMAAAECAFLPRGEAGGEAVRAFNKGRLRALVITVADAKARARARSSRLLHIPAREPSSANRLAGAVTVEHNDALALARYSPLLTVRRCVCCVMRRQPICFCPRAAGSRPVHCVAHLLRVARRARQ